MLLLPDESCSAGAVGLEINVTGVPLPGVPMVLTVPPLGIRLDDLTEIDCAAFIEVMLGIWLAARVAPFTPPGANSVSPSIPAPAAVILPVPAFI